MLAMDAAPVVLIADDDPEYCHLVEEILRDDGFEVLLAYDGKRAMELVHTRQPRVVILDSMLPSKCGFDCLAEIRGDDLSPRTHVLMCSGKGDLDYVVRCLQAGADGFLHKPVSGSRLRDSVRKALRAPVAAPPPTPA